MAHDKEIYQKAREVAVDAAWAAARLIRPYAGQAERAGVREKGIHDLVTDLDEQAQEKIVEIITEAFPDHAILAEEGAELDQVDTRMQGFRWIIDPIDGTTNFTHGVPLYAVSIGLAHRGEMVVGVVLDVAHEELFTAVRGGGAFLNGRRMHVSRCSALNDALLTTGFPFRAFGHVDLYLEVLRAFFLKTRGIRRPGVASIDLAYVACGRFDGFFETGLNPWDVAAGVLLIEEAGGTVTNYCGEPNPIFDKQVLASNRHLHTAMQEVLTPMQDIRD